MEPALERASWDRWLAVLPAAVFLALALPVLTFSFLSDDYNFLLRAYEFRVSQLVPDPTSVFYRPVSRELYFGLLAFLSKSNPLWGHVINAVLAAVCILLMTNISRRLLGNRQGLVTGFLFASVGAFPFLVGWVSGCQDLLAMLFIVAAMNYELRGRSFVALGWTAAALLSKETAAFFLPGLAILSSLIRTDRLDLRRGLARYGALGALWSLLLLKHGPYTGTAGYLGVDGGAFVRHLTQELCALINIPIGGTAASWPAYLNAVCVAGVAIVALAIWLDARSGSPTGRAMLSRSRPLVFGALFGVLPAILTAASSKHWFPYYACLPAIGTSVILAVLLQRVGSQTAAWATVAFLILGVWFRGLEFGTRATPMEQNFRITSANLRKIEDGLKRLHPAFSDSVRLWVTVQTSYDLAIQSYLFSRQAARVWYANPTLVTENLGRLRADSRLEYFLGVTPTCGVFEIRLADLTARSTGTQLGVQDYQNAIRSYAYALLGTGQVDRATGVLLAMKEPESTTQALDRRLAATMLYAKGRSAEAAALCASLPPLDREAALQEIAAALRTDVAGVALDEAAFKAFGWPEDDPEAYRSLMRYFSSQVLLPQAQRMAERLLVLRPGDEQALAMLEAIRALPAWEQPVPAVDQAGR